MAAATPQRISAQIAGWWRENPNYNVAVATGPVSKVFVLDVDGLDAEASLRKLEATIRCIARRPWKASPRAAGIYFSNAKMAQSEIAPARLLPASISEATAAMSCCHRPYIRVAALMYGASTAQITLPKLRLGSAICSAESPTAIARAQAKSPEHWHSVIANTIRNGARNSTLTSICGKLLHAGLTELAFLYDVMCCINIARCEEPLSESEVHTIVVSVARTHLKRLRGDA